MNTNRKIIILEVTGALCILAVSITIFLIIRYPGGRDNINKYNAVLVATVHEGGNTWEVYKSSKYQQVILIFNGKIKATKPFDVSGVEAKKMDLPDMKNIQGVDITTKAQYCSLTWNASLNEAAQAVKWLEDRGCTIEFEADTQTFIELYMKDTIGKYKRVLIMQGQISITDIKEYTFKTINDYIN